MSPVSPSKFTQAVLSHIHSQLFMLLLFYSLTMGVPRSNTFARNSIMSPLDLRYSLCSLLASVTHTWHAEKRLSRDLNVKFQHPL